MVTPVLHIVRINNLWQHRKWFQGPKSKLASLWYCFVTIMKSLLNRKLKFVVTVEEGLDPRSPPPPSTWLCHWADRILWSIYYRTYVAAVKHFLTCRHKVTRETSLYNSHCSRIVIIWIHFLILATIAEIKCTCMRLHLHCRCIAWCTWNCHFRVANAMKYCITRSVAGAMV